MTMKTESQLFFYSRCNNVGLRVDLSNTMLSRSLTRFSCFDNGDDCKTHGRVPFTCVAKQALLGYKGLLPVVFQLATSALVSLSLVAMAF